MKELYAIDKSTLDAIGNAIRSKKGTTEPIPVTSLASEIASIESGSVGILLQAGKYKMIDYQYEGSYPGSFAWKSQELKGRYYVNEDSSGADFTTISNDGMYCLTYYNNGSYVADILPYWNPYDYFDFIVLDEAQFISEAFSTWFNTCFESVIEENLVPENIKKGVTILGVTGTYEPPKVDVSELSVIRSGEFAIINNYPDCYLDYDDGGEYGGAADIVGTYSEDGTVYEFDKIGLGGNTDGPPYATISLYKNGEHVYSIGGDDGWSPGENWYFNIPSDSIATKIFCALFMGMVLRKE